MRNISVILSPSLNQNEINAEVEWFIRGMIADERFHEYIGERLQEKVDVSNLGRGTESAEGTVTAGCRGEE